MSSAGNPQSQFSALRRCVESRTSWIDSFISKAPSDGSGGEAAFSVTLQCKVTRTLKPGRRCLPEQVRYHYVGGGGNETFTATQAVDIPHDKEGVRDVLQRLMRTVEPLQLLNLTECQWEHILPLYQSPWFLYSRPRRARPTGRTASPTRQLDLRSTKKSSSACHLHS